MLFRSPSDPPRFMRQGKAELVHDNIKKGESEPHLSKLTPVFHHFSSVASKQLSALSHLGCNCEAGGS